MMDMETAQKHLAQAAPHCPSCGRVTWHFPDEQETGTYQLVYNPADEMADLVPRNVLVVICKHCGFVRMHDIEMLEKEGQREDARRILRLN